MELAPLKSEPSDAAIVYLHGSGERGNDLQLVTRFGLPAAVLEGRTRAGCPIVCPQLEADAEWDAHRVSSLIGRIRERYMKVALVGYSLGASGVCSVVAQLGAVADVHVAIAGQAPDEVAVSQEQVRFLAIQGELDTWPRTGEFVKAINRLGGVAAGITLPALGHYVSEEALEHPAVLSMLGAVGIRLSLSSAA